MDILEEALKACADEPIHIPGAIQPSGLLCTTDLRAKTILRASESLIHKVKPTPSKLLGQSTHVLFNQAIRHALRNISGYKDLHLRAASAGYLTWGNQEYGLLVHRTNTELVIEFLPTHVPKRKRSSSYLDQVQNTITRLEYASSTEDLIHEGILALKSLTPFNRVMAYRFLAENAGEVIAEAKSDYLNSFLGLRFPASDIPPQARRLYQKTDIRIIPSVEEAPVHILSQISSPLDLSLSMLRAVSPLHIQYLKNMGVASSLSLPIIINQKLWGLIACHGDVPFIPTTDLLSACKLVRKSINMELRWRIQHKLEAQVHSASLATKKMVMLDASSPQTNSEKPQSPSINTLPQIHSERLWSDIQQDLSKLFDNHGVYLYVDETLYSNNKQLDVSSELLNYLRSENKKSSSGITSYTSLNVDTRCPSSQVAGALVISMNTASTIQLIYFRHPSFQIIRWGGSPEKSLVSSRDGWKLNPRSSFKEYLQSVSDQSDAWTAEELLLAQAIQSEFREAFSDINNFKYIYNHLTRANSELSHRIKNTFTILQSLLREARQSSDSVDAFSQIMQNQLNALSNAHKLLTNSADREISIYEILETELSISILQPDSSRIRFNGPEIAFKAHAISSLVIILHELTTNAIKHGTLSNTSGQLDITWTLSEHGLHLSWEEDAPQLSTVKDTKPGGLGLNLIIQIASYDLGGQADIKTGVSGLKANLWLPNKVLAQAASSAPQPQKKVSIQLTKSSRVLVVEDNYLLAKETAYLISKHFDCTVDCASSVDTATQYLNQYTYDFCLLDIDLGGKDSYEIADRLTKANIRSAFVTGHDLVQSAASTYPSIPVLTKPITAADLGALLTRSK